eukprot:1805622-Pyramimonas_sp.AAC.1
MTGDRRAPRFFVARTMTEPGAGIKRAPGREAQAYSTGRVPARHTQMRSAKETKGMTQLRAE